MQLELPVRWTETQTETSEIEELINKKAKEKYSYGKLLINSEDIGPYYDIDDNNTMINDRLGKMYCVTIPLNQFKKILTEVTGRAIMAIQVKEEYKQDKSKPRKQDTDEDILD